MSRTLALRLMTLLLVYLLSALTLLNRILYSLVKDRYRSYQVIFYLALLLASYIIFPVQRMGLRTPQVMVLGALNGYLASLAAFFFLPLFQFGGLQRVFTIRDLSGSFFLSPLPAMSWLMGIYFGVGILWGRRVNTAVRLMSASSSGRT
jgi:hypothetical protein